MKTKSTQTRQVSLPTLVLFLILTGAALAAPHTPKPFRQDVVADSPLPSCPIDDSDLTRYRAAIVEWLRTRTDQRGTASEGIEKCYQGRELPKPLVTLLGLIKPTGIPNPKTDAAAGNIHLPDFFLTGDYPTVPADIEDIAKKNGWLITPFKTRGYGGFDPTTSSLEIVEIPGATLSPPQTVNWYILWGLQPDPSRTSEYDNAHPVPSTHVPTGGGFAGIAMDQHPDMTATAYFYDFDGDKGPDLKAYRGNTNMCLQCHANGLREISPRGYYPIAGETRLPDDVRKKVSDINRQMRYRSVDFGLLTAGTNLPFQPDQHGPLLGEGKADLPVTALSRTPEFILGTRAKPGCAFTNTRVSIPDPIHRTENDREFIMDAKASDLPNVPSLRPAKIAGAMVCASCHDGEDRRGLTLANASRALLDSKILQDGSMPLHAGSDLTKDERIALTNCLISESQGEYIPWLEKLLRASDSSTP